MPLILSGKGTINHLDLLSFALQQAPQAYFLTILGTSTNSNNGFGLDPPFLRTHLCFTTLPSRENYCHPRSSWSHNPESAVFLAHTQPTSDFSLGYISHWRTELTEAYDCHSSATGLPHMGQMSGVTPSTCHSLCRHSSWHFELRNHSPKCVCRLFSFFFMMLFFFFTEHQRDLAHHVQTPAVECLGMY